ncbi:MAG TPA: TolC family protein [Bryobacteraceae bacterium]|nr:TolC family protein [Bryobacteraceae bacterium]
MASPAVAQTDAFTLPGKGGFAHWFTRAYTPHRIASLSFADSDRIEKLIRGGNIYLSLRDAIALALENNLDIEVARLQPKLNLTNLQRSEAGQLLRNLSTNITSGPNSAALGVLASNGVGNTGTTGAASNSNNGVLSGVNVQLAGSQIPNLDPTFFTSFTAAHQTTIETTTAITGTTSFISSYKNWTMGLQQGYWTGTTVQLYENSIFGLNQNATTALFNPVDQASLNLSITQNLLNGFGIAVNKRALHVAKNNLHVSDLQFKEQVIATVGNVVNLYWDLVSFNDDLKVKQHTLELDTTLYNDNQRRAELGSIAPIDTIQAESEMKSAQQDVVTQETQVLQQELILKSVLTRSGFDNAAVVSAHIIPTDHIDVPEKDPVYPLQDLVADAMKNRPEVEANTISLANARLNMLGTKSNLLPTLSANVTLSNSGQAGSVAANTQVPIIGANGNVVGYRPITAADVNGFLLGGYGTVLGQIFGRNFPNYSAQVSLTIPLRNRAAQADLITDELNYRQSEIQDKQLHNNIKLNVINAYTTMQQARAAYEAVIVARKLQDQTLAGTRRKYELGTSTITDVVIAQRDDTTRQLNEVDARRQYINARNTLRQQMGTILEDYNVDIDEAKTGMVKREADIPVVVNQQNNNKR